MEAIPRAEHVKDLVLASLQCEPEQRDEFIHSACAYDELLENEVKSLLRFDSENDDRLEVSALEVSAASLARKALYDSDQAFAGDIGRYRLVQEIARGGMGVVYEGARIDGEYEQRVAIKLIASGQDSEFIARRFRKERQILANLNHANIARLLDGGTTEDGLPYLVMEYVDGLPIDKYADANDLTTVERLELFRKVCSAVEYAHQNLVIHRDVKPRNILVDEEGVPKLLDFGIAKLLLPESSKDTAAQTTAMLVMTPEYSSPEQVRGEAVSNATDIYSLGVVLFKLLTGRLPYRFKSNRIDEVARVISTQQPEKPSTATTSNSGVSSDSKRYPMTVPDSITSTNNGNGQHLGRKLRGDLDNIVLMALRKEPERRYASVEQFSEDIRRHLGGLPIIARKDTLAYRSTKFFKRNKTLVVSGVVIALICLLLGSFFTLSSVRAKPKTSVAVLPFVNSGRDPNMDYLCAGITDNLLGELSRIGGLTVPGHNSVFRYKDKPVNLQSVTTELAVETVLTGNVTTDGSDVLVGITLSDRSGQSILNRQYRAKASDIQRMQAEIAQDVSSGLGWKLDDGGYRKLRGTQNVEAYKLYLQGSHAWNQRTPEAFFKAGTYYDAAIKLDSQYALAYTGLANSYSLLGAYLILSPDESFGKAKQFATKALEIDPNLAEAHTSMALIRWLYDWDWAAADREFKRAIELDPGYPLAHHWYGLFLGEMNHPDEAIAEEKRALQLDPLSAPIMADLARVYHFARRYDESLEQFKKTNDQLMGAATGDVKSNLGDLYQQMGNTTELAVLYYPDREMLLALERGGMRAFWLQGLERLQRSWRSTGWLGSTPYFKAELLARLHENDRAIESLNQAYKTRNHLMTQLKVNPAFDGLRSDPRFIELLRRMSLTS